MAANNVLKINNVAIATPQSMQWDLYDIDSESTRRNQEGTLLRDRVATKRKLECQWPPLSPDEMATLLTAVSGVTFSLTYPDAMTGQNKTGTFYVGDRTAPVYYWNPTTGKYLWTNLKMNFIEV